MSLYDDIREGLKRALILNEKVELMDRSVQRLAQDVRSLADHLHDVDKRLIRIETMADLSVSARPRIEPPGGDSS